MDLLSQTSSTSVKDSVPKTTIHVPQLETMNEPQVTLPGEVEVCSIQVKQSRAVQEIHNDLNTPIKDAEGKLRANLESQSNDMDTHRL